MVAQSRIIVTFDVENLNMTTSLFWSFGDKSCSQERVNKFPAWHGAKGNVAPRVSLS